MEESWKVTLIKRILPGIFCFGLGFGGLTFSTGAESQLGILGRALLAVAFLILGAIFLAKPLAVLIASPLITLIYPEDHAYAPPPLYGLPEMYLRQGRTLDAVAEYQKILHYHPRELRAYLSLLEVAFLHLQDRTLAQKTYKAGMRRLKSHEDRTRLKDTFESLRAGASVAASSIEKIS